MRMNSLNSFIPEWVEDALLGAHRGSVHDVVVQDVDELADSNIPEWVEDALLGAHRGSVHDVVVQDVDELT